MKKILIGCVLAAGLLLSGCGADAVPSSSSAETDATSSQSQELYAMDTVMTLTAYGPQAETALADAADEIERLDALWSISSSDGEIARLNADKQAALSDDTIALMKRAQEISASTGGLFACTIEPVMEAWGFTNGNYTVPDTATLQSLLAHVDDTQIAIDGSTVTIPTDVKVDLGGIAKGFTSDRVMELFAADGVESGIISLGGNVQTLGTKPDGSLWRVGIQDPDDSSDIIATIEVADKAVITSGGYQRYFEQNGTTYHHIIDPRTGMPANSGLTSVTIVSDDGTLADGLSTSLFIMGKEAALDYWRTHRDDFDVILVASDGSVTISEGLADCCTLSDGSTPEVAQ